MNNYEFKKGDIVRCGLTDNPCEVRDIDGDKVSLKRDYDDINYISMNKSNVFLVCKVGDRHDYEYIKRKTNGFK